MGWGVCVAQYSGKFSYVFKCCFVGNGVVLHIPTFMQEIKTNEEKGIKDMKKRMKISDRTHIGISFLLLFVFVSFS